MESYECDGCGADVELHLGTRTGLVYYNCDKCGMKVNWPTGTKGHAEFVKRGLIPGRA